MPASPDSLNLRAFLAQVEANNPKDILRFKERIALDYDATAIALELERGRAWQAPVLWFDNVADSAFPLVTNVFATRGRYAMALGVAEDRLIEEWAARGDRSLEPVLHAKGPVQDVVYKGADVDLARIPIKKHFERDGGRSTSRNALPCRSKCPPKARSCSKATSCPACASPKARSRNSPATTRNAPRKT